MEVTSFRQLVAEVLKNYAGFKAEVEKSQSILQEGRLQIAEIKAQVLSAQENLTQAKENTKQAQNLQAQMQASTSLANTQAKEFEKGLRQLHSLREEYARVCNSLEQFNALTSTLKKLDLENLIRETLKRDSTSIMAFSKVLDELMLGEKYQELLAHLSQKLNTQLDSLSVSKTEFESLKNAFTLTRNTIFGLNGEIASARNAMQRELENAKLQNSRVLREQASLAKRAVNGYVRDFYKVISQLQSKALLLKVSVSDSLDQALKSYQARIENSTQEHLQILEQNTQNLQEKYASLEAGMHALEKLNSALATGKVHKFRYNIFTALQYINTAERILMEQDSLLSNAMVFYHENFSKEVLSFLIKERQNFNAQMQAQENKINAVLKSVAKSEEDIALKRRQILFLTLKKG
ncbi:hypothetical protein [Helicobacter sp.]|uniref:hypothetical protein n=1 Tax=Helicobacter sp. TaxID=218 RepID=UPI002A75D666|nr:hypothetical protein [Helicobacter sp.]MDY2584089.1 hypothetical protein [Helicobacter sp.]